MAPLSNRAVGWAANHKQVTIANSVLVSAATITVGLRFIARIRLKNKLGWDEFFVVLSLATYWAHVATNFEAALDGTLDIDFKTMSMDKISESLKLTFVNIFIMSFTITFARLSIIFLYNRIFGVYSGFRKMLWLNGFLSVSWLLTAIFLNCFRCRPMKAAWNPTIKGACLELETLFLYTEIINCLLDLALVLLPGVKISKLQLSIRDKIGLCIVFFAGSFVCVTSIMRIVFAYGYFATNPNLSEFWLSLQLAFAIICANLPTLRSYLPKRAPSASTLRRYMASWKTYNGSSHDLNDEMQQKGKILGHSVDAESRGGSSSGSVKVER
jgi:hypothetical protein